jgi:thiol:disulfide interchange protein DsbD
MDIGRIIMRTPGKQVQPLLPSISSLMRFGLAAIFTPCVFPMIPITMSFFLGQESLSVSLSIGLKPSGVFGCKQSAP